METETQRRIRYANEDARRARAQAEAEQSRDVTWANVEGFTNSVAGILGGFFGGGGGGGGGGVKVIRVPSQQAPGFNLMDDWPWLAAAGVGVYLLTNRRKR